METVEEGGVKKRGVATTGITLANGWRVECLAKLPRAASRTSTRARAYTRSLTPITLCARRVQVRALVIMSYLCTRTEVRR